ncbi:hypothetical protein JB92DRAFT_1768643 [Gautieria morchelliformis]|nr:hypothetical protein JB92DRAFT_1768643 [Gautieria morchelliformis]
MGGHSHALSMSAQAQESAMISSALSPPRRPSSPSFADSIPSGTHSSLSFVWGPGALAGKFLKWLGGSTLNGVAVVVVAVRLAVIKQTVREKPQLFQDASLTPAESREVRRIYDDLEEVCRQELFPSAIRRKAARLVLEIAFLEYLYQFDTLSELTGSLLSMRANLEDPWDRWSMLLRLSILSAFSKLRVDPTTFPQLPRSVSTANSIGFTSTVPTTTSATPRTTSSGFLSEARTSVTSLFGPGSTTQKTILVVSARRKLSRIKRTIRRQPFIFLGSHGVKEMQEVDYIYNELQDLTGRCVVSMRYVYLIAHYCCHVTDPMRRLTPDARQRDWCSRFLFSSLVPVRFSH